MLVGPSVLPALLVLSGVLAGAVGVAVWRHRPKKGATWLSITAFAFVPSGIAAAAILTRSTADAAVRWAGVSHIGLALIPPAWLLFAARYTGRDSWLTPARIVAIWTPAAVYAVIAVANPAELVFAGATLSADGALAFDWGPVALAYFVYIYTMVLPAEGLLLTKALRSRNVYRRRTVLFVLIGVVVMVGHLLEVVGPGPVPHFGVTPLLFLLVGVVSLLVLYDDRFLQVLPAESVIRLFGAPFEDIGPIARDAVIEEMGSGVVVLDGDNRIVDLNPEARRMLGAEDRRIVGTDLRDVVDPEAFVDDDLPFLDPVVAEGRYTEVWIDPPRGPRRCYDIVVSDLSEKDHDVDGRVAIVHDVTERQRRKQQLERQTRELERKNEHLEEFASIVSHDLRNPLNVAIGQLDVEMDEHGSSEYLERVQDAHERMEEIIEDVLALARQGQSVESTEPVDLARVAEDAWETVDTEAATLDVDVDEDETVSADPARLRRALENLFRNSIEHAPGDADPTAMADGDDESVTITVGELADGFYVADDGPGIPPEERERVLEQGYTTSDDGSGFGLAIVESIVEAHGWELQVAESESGGARFEITGTYEPVDAAGEGARLPR